MVKEFTATITQKYIRKLKRLKNNGISSRRNVELVEDLSNMLDQLKKVILDHPEKFTMRWSLGLERYIYTLKESKKNISKSRKFTPSVRRGHIVETELFGHFNSELTFLHPGLVLYDGADRILIAPISTGYYNSGNPLHINIGVKEGMAHDCAISLADIYMVNKNRILYVHSKDNEYIKLPDTVLNAIDETMSKKFMPAYFKKFENKQKQIDCLLKENHELNMQIQDLKIKEKTFENNVN